MPEGFQILILKLRYLTVNCNCAACIWTINHESRSGVYVWHHHRGKRNVTFCMPPAAMHDTMSGSLLYLAKAAAFIQGFIARLMLASPAAGLKRLYASMHELQPTPMKTVMPCWLLKQACHLQDCVAMERHQAHFIMQDWNHFDQRAESKTFVEHAWPTYLHLLI